jgi:hypothetical protein
LICMSLMADGDDKSRIYPKDDSKLDGLGLMLCNVRQADPVRKVEKLCFIYIQRGLKTPNQNNRKANRRKCTNSSQLRLVH